MSCSASWGSRRMVPFAIAAWFAIAIPVPSAAYDFCIDSYGSDNVRTFLAGLQKAVASNQRSDVAKIVAYPISITVDKKKITIHNQQQFLKYYDAALNENVKLALAQQEPSTLF